MKRNFRRLATLSLSAALVMSNSLAVLAAGNEQTGSGEAEYEGYVDQTSAFTVTVPTAAANQFNFTVDPNGLLKGTDYARMLLDGASADNFDPAANLYFKNTHKVSDADVDWYTNSSLAIEMVNQSSYDVDVEVTASVTGATGITLVNAAPTGNTGDPSLYLAIITDDTDTEKQTIAIGDEGGTYSSEIAGVPANFMIRYVDGAYAYVERTNTNTSKTYNKNGDEVTSGGTAGTALDAWNTVSFNLTGACGGAWTDAQAELEIGVELTWKVTDPNATPATPAAVAPSIANASVALTAGQDAEITVNLGTGDKAATGITSAKWNNVDLLGSTVTFANGKVTMSSASVDYLVANPDQPRTLEITFNDTAATKVTVTFTTE